MRSAPAWCDATGKPTVYAIRAALHVAVLLDDDGSRTEDTRESYWHHATGGLYAPADLYIGERMLIDCGLVHEIEGRLRPTSLLHNLLDGTLEDASALIFLRAVELIRDSPARGLGVTMDSTDASLIDLIPDGSRREEMLLSMARRFDDAHRRIIGAIGEELVVRAVREELAGLGYPELARAVRHVSLESDQLGYDVSAPNIAGPSRLMEVKSTTIADPDVLTIYLSRNEADAGFKFPNWSLVVCHISDVTNRVGEILGWCGASALHELLPTDTASGHWEQSRIRLRASVLALGFPSATL